MHCQPSQWLIDCLDIIVLLRFNPAYKLPYKQTTWLIDINCNFMTPMIMFF